MKNLLEFPTKEIEKPTKQVIALDSSQMTQFDICPLSWKYAYRDRLRLTFSGNRAANRGTLGHWLLEHYYKQIAEGILPNEAANTAITKFQDEKPWQNLEEKHDINFLIGRFSDYVLFYRDNDIVVAKSAGGISAVELGFSKTLAETPKFIYVVEGKIDLLFQFNNAICFLDHKFQARVSALYANKPQFLTYAWATGAKYGGGNYIGMSNVVTAKTFQRKIGAYSVEAKLFWEKRMLRIFNTLAFLTEHGLLDEDSAYDTHESSCAGAWERMPCHYTKICENYGRPELKEAIKNALYIKAQPWQPWSIVENEEES